MTIYFDLRTGKISAESNSYTVSVSSLETAGDLPGIFANAPGSRPCGSIEGAQANEAALGELAKLTNEADHAGLKELVAQRSAAAVYLEALERRKGFEEQLSELDSKISSAKNRARAKDPAKSLAAAIEERSLTGTYREISEEQALLDAQLAEYRALTAQAAALSSIIREEQERAAGVFLEYSRSEVGDLVEAGTYEIGTAEWHEARNGGIGGSDVGSIMKVDAAWGSLNYARTMDGKLGLDPTGGHVDVDRMDFRTAIGRGNGWEEFIRQDFQDRHPELRVAFCKTSFEGRECSYRKANFDGLILNADGDVDEIIEIKTGSNLSKWGPVSEGFSAVPEGYRKQVLWYALNARARGGRVVAVLHDRDYREYSFSMEDPAIREEVAAIIEATDSFWSEVLSGRQQIAAGTYVATSKRRTKDFRKSSQLETASKVLAAYGELSEAQALELLRKAISEEAAKLKGELSTKGAQRAVAKAFASIDPAMRKKPFIGIDLETSSASTKTGRIIETGIGRLEPLGKPYLTYSTRHGIPEIAAKGRGVGLTDIHGLTVEDLAGKPRFDDQAEQKKILAELTSGTLVAHNASFEDRFLAAHLPGYIEARASGKIRILDTRRLAETLMPQTKGSTLEEFAEATGVPYEGEHSAPQDTLMMLRALGRFQNTLHREGAFQRRRATKEERESSLRNLAER